MPTIKGTMPLDAGPELPCVWCGQPTDIRFVPAGRPDLGPQPLHLLCGASLVRAYDRWLRGHVLGDRDLARLAALNR